MINTGRQTLLTGELVAAKSREALRIALGNVRQSFNYDHVSLMKVPTEQDRAIAPLMLESTLPAVYVREYDRAQLLPASPIATQLRRSQLPISWSVQELAKTATKQAAKDAIALMERHKLITGSVFSFYLCDGNRYAIRFDGQRAVLTQSEMNELALLSLHALDVFGQIHISRDQNHNPLSARELEVVSWTAQGKTSVEIGQILSLSDHTVNAYLTNAIRKLDCVNRTQLVAKSIRLKLIA